MLDGLKKKPAVGRKPKKEIKSRQKKVKGTAKAKVQAGKQKKWDNQSLHLPMLLGIQEGEEPTLPL